MKAGAKHYQALYIARAHLNARGARDFLRVLITVLDDIDSMSPDYLPGVPGELMTEARAALEKIEPVCERLHVMATQNPLPGGKA